MFCGSLADWSAEYAGFTVDAIAMFHVLEHLEDPVEVLEECRSVLADDGRLFIEVPNGSSRAAKSLDPAWDRWQFGFHYWHYTPPALHALTGRAGLRILELREVTARVYNTRPPGASLGPRICRRDTARLTSTTSASWPGAKGWLCLLAVSPRRYPRTATRSVGRHFLEHPG